MILFATGPMQDVAVPRVPLELIPLGDDEKKNDSTLFT